jgi:hypothetical protein
MSFVHCPACHRAYDLRRRGSCPRCVVVSAPTIAARTIAGPARSATVVSPEPGPAGAAARGAVVPAEEAVAEVARASGSVPERIVALVDELAAVMERASIAELERASGALAALGLTTPGRAPRLAAGARWLAAGERAVRAADASRHTVRRLAGRLRDAWSALGSSRA